MGRFISEDFIKAYTTVLYTLNHYGYCCNRPLDLVDLDGILGTIESRKSKEAKEGKE